MACQQLTLTLGVHRLNRLAVAGHLGENCLNTPGDSGVPLHVER